MSAALFFGLWIAVVVLTVFLISRSAQTAKQPIFADMKRMKPSQYILLTVFAWIVETNLKTIAVLGCWLPTLNRERPHWSLWAPLTLWWPPEVLSHWPSHSWAAWPGLLLSVVVLALGGAVIISILRLRNAGLPSWIGLLAMIPFVNFGLFLLLSVVPSRPPRRSRSWKEYLMPKDQLGSAVVSCLITAALGIGLSQFSTAFLGHYGWALFTVLPVVMGFVAAVTYGMSEPRSCASCVSVAVASALLAGLAILGFAIEGAICILMAAPLAIPLAAFGGWLGYMVQRRSDETAQIPQIAGALLAFLPFMMYSEQRARTEAREIAVSTRVVIHASAERVWEKVIRLASVPKPDSVIFDSVAYPIRTSLDGNGIGAMRQCVFSTGSIVEPISVWAPGRELRFSVISQPPLMRELTPYADVHPPHLKLEYLRSKEGQFTLTPLADGTTLLTGTSYYESRLWPGAYWEMWTNTIAHKVHQVVLEEIKRQAEM